MPLDEGGAGQRKRRHWAYIPIRVRQVYVSGKWKSVAWNAPAAKRFKSRIVKGNPAWVRVGSPRYIAIRKQGFNPIAIKAGKRPASGTVPVKGSTPGNPSGKSMAPKGVKPGKPIGKPGVGGVGGGGGGRRRRRGGGNQTQRAINQQLGSANAGKALGKGYAENVAGLQFDAPIHDLKTLIARLGPQNQQAIADITNWYGNVSQLNQRAGARAGDIAENVAGNQDQAIAGLMGALGGGANDANAALAQSNLRDTGLLRALGGIEQQYHSDLDPVLAHAQANAQALTQRRNVQQMQDYQLQLADLMGQRGQAKAGAQMEVDKYNNELTQQWFQNKLAKLNANLGAQAAGVDLRVKRAALRAQKKESSGKFVPWRSLNPAEKTQLLQAAVYNPNGTRRSLDKARSYLVGLGYSAGHLSPNPGILSSLRSFYQ
jgi:hypothetical protein